MQHRVLAFAGLGHQGGFTHVALNDSQTRVVLGQVVTAIPAQDVIDRHVPPCIEQLRHHNAAAIATTADHQYVFHSLDSCYLIE